MLNDIQTYCIHLEDYALPRYATASRCYYGTMDDMLSFANNLSKIDLPGTRYSDIIAGIEHYNTDPDMCHSVAGTKYTVLTPVEVICQNDFIFDDYTWLYFGHSGTALPMTATQANVSQILVHNKNEYHRCIKAKLKDVHCNYPTIGLIRPPFEQQGFPCMVQKTDDNIYTLQLYAMAQSYPFYKKDEALADMQNLDLVALSEASRDFMGYM